MGVITGPEGKIGDIAVPGLERPMRYRGLTTDRRAFEQVFISRQYDCALLGTPKVIVDGGANVGYCAAYFSRAFPDARIIAVEAAGSNMPLLAHNTEGLKGVEVLHAALWNNDEPVEIEDPNVDTWSFTVKKAAASTNGEARTVEGITVPSLMKRYNLDFIDFLKLDIEGAEYALFDSSEEWIDKVGVIAVELHEHKAPGCTEVFERAIEGRVADRVRHHENEFVRLRA